MANRLIEFLLGILGGLTGSLIGKYTLLFVISLLPILELRGGLIAASLLDIQPLEAFLICFIANVLIIPFVLFLMEFVMDLLSKIGLFKKILDWWKNKALSKKETIEKFGYFGIMLFVAIPLPGSGAWTGCLLAVLLGLDKRRSFVTAFIGVLISGIIMMIFSYGILKGILNT